MYFSVTMKMFKYKKCGNHITLQYFKNQSKADSNIAQSKNDQCKSTEGVNLNVAYRSFLRCIPKNGVLYTEHKHKNCLPFL